MVRPFVQSPRLLGGGEAMGAETTLSLKSEAQLSEG